MEDLKKHFMSKYNIDTEEELSEQLEEIVLDTCEIIATQDRNEHRWYILETHIFKETINNVSRYFAFQWPNMKGENCTSDDIGYELKDINKIWEVFPKEVTTIIYE